MNCTLPRRLLEVRTWANPHSCSWCDARRGHVTSRVIAQGNAKKVNKRAAALKMCHLWHFASFISLLTILTGQEFSEKRKRCFNSLSSKDTINCNVIGFRHIWSSRYSFNNLSGTRQISNKQESALFWSKKQIFPKGFDFEAFYCYSEIYVPKFPLWLWTVKSLQDNW